MIYILFFLVAALFIGSFFLFNKEILSPTFIVCGVFLISVLFACLYANKWQISISYITVIVITTVLFTFGLGELFVRRVLFRRKNISESVIPNKPIRIPLWSIIIIVLFAGALIAVNFLHIISLAEIVGYERGVSEKTIIYYVREASLKNITSRSAYYSIVIHGQHIICALGYVFCFIFIFNAVFFRKYKKNMRNIIPVLAIFPFIVLSGGRTGLILLVSEAMIIFALFFMQKNKWTQSAIRQISKTVLVGFITFYMLFIIAGSFKSEAFSKKPIDAIAFYTGLSIPSLDKYLNDESRSESNYFGEETLSSFYGIIKKTGVNVPDEYIQYKHLEFTRFVGVEGNVYTAIRRLLHDYGWVGMYCLMFFFGMFYSSFFIYIKNKQTCAVILYAIVFYAAIMMSIDEQFFVTVLSLSFLERMFFIFIFYEIFVRKFIDLRIWYNNVFKNSKIK
jgi:oligosaccharide repeat unit polymerase